MNIKNYKSFNEGLLGGLSSKVSKAFNKLKVIGGFGDGNSVKLKKWGISTKKVSETYYQIIHDNKIIAEVRVTGEGYKPIFKLSIYFYDSEIENTKNLELNKKFDGQKEQPYGKASKDFYTTESAIDFLISFWSTKTNSGKSKNPQFKINL
jgi:hypothetical protein